jgi:adenine/guanine phosphoribosyltransferase-like PRPP-binding protein
MTDGRSKLRIQDLKSRSNRGPTRLINVKVPAATAAAIDQLAERLKASKTDLVVALLNEALALAQVKMANR